MSLRGQRSSARSNLLLSAKIASPPTNGGSQHLHLAQVPGSAGVTSYLIHDTLVLLLQTEQFTPFWKENLLGPEAFT